MALTEAQRTSIRLYLGWGERFHQFDSRLEQAFEAMGTRPEAELLITDTLANGGILASLLDIDSKLVDAHKRVKADTVGSIKLNRRELKQLYRDGNRFVGRLARMLGVPVREGGPYSTSLPTSYHGHGGLYNDTSGGNFVGK